MKQILDCGNDANNSMNVVNFHLVKFDRTKAAYNIYAILSYIPVFRI